jgi:hypothetical protein
VLDDVECAHDAEPPSGDRFDITVEERLVREELLEQRVARFDAFCVESLSAQVPDELAAAAADVEPRCTRRNGETAQQLREVRLVGRIVAQVLQVRRVELLEGLIQVRIRRLPGEPEPARRAVEVVHAVLIEGELCGCGAERAADELHRRQRRTSASVEGRLT